MAGRRWCATHTRERAVKKLQPAFIIAVFLIAFCATAALSVVYISMEEEINITGTCAQCGAVVQTAMYWEGTRKTIDGQSVPDRIDFVYCGAACSLTHKQIRGQKEA